MILNESDQSELKGQLKVKTCDRRQSVTKKNTVTYGQVREIKTCKLMARLLKERETKHVRTGAKRGKTYHLNLSTSFAPTLILLNGLLPSQNPLGTSVESG